MEKPHLLADGAGTQALVQLSQRNHDRFLIIDDIVYILGASVKDMGVGLCAITQMQAQPEVILQWLK